MYNNYNNFFIKNKYYDLRLKYINIINLMGIDVTF